MIVYLARNKINGMCYVGQTARALEVRIKEHIRHCRRTDRNKGIFHKALLKNGPDAFVWEVLGRAKDREALDRLEQAWVERLNSRSPQGYNLESGGNRNKRHSEESKARIAASNTGVVFSAERRARISKSKRGQKYTPRTPEHCAAISAAKMGRKTGPQTEEHRRKCALARSGENNSLAKLTSRQVEEIKALASAGFTTRDLVAKFPVHKTTINRIKAGKARVNG
ncbi:GIY-YIG nuclease family protein [Novosphingobium sp. NPDC080210]|uniref:GIY-YIG nuclease family protein n=1 Tax=Novosphingobium sp. NPDC080210 TaxID=3390596 RepID=UPI003D00489E